MHYAARKNRHRYRRHKGYRSCDSKDVFENGANVALFGSRSETVGKALKELKEENPNWPVIGMAPDIAKYDEMKAAVDEVVAKFGALDIMVNNAGISARSRFAIIRRKAFNT